MREVRTWASVVRRESSVSQNERILRQSVFALCTVVVLTMI